MIKKILTNLRMIAEVLYLKYGVNIVGYKDSSKTPIQKWKKLQNERQGKAAALGMKWHLLSGVGIVLGPIGNVHAFDIDKSNLAEAKKLLAIADLPQDYEWLVESGSGEGFHVYFKSDNLINAFSHKSVIVITNSPAVVCKQIELRICGLIVAPGSKHKSGRTYKFVNANAFDKEMIFLSPDRVKQIVEKITPSKPVGDESTEAKQQEPTTSTSASKDALFVKVADCIDQLKQLPAEQRGTIADDYKSWSRIGFGLAFDLDEDGRQLFHEFSRLSSKYTETGCNAAYDGFLKSQRKSVKNPITVGTVFFLLKQIGISPRKNAADELEPEKANQFYSTIRIINDRYKLALDTFTDTMYVDGKPLDERHLNNMVIYLQAKFGFDRISKDYLQNYLGSDYVPKFHRIHQLLANHKPLNLTGNLQKLADTISTDTADGIFVTWHGQRRPFKDVIIEIFYMKMITQFEEARPNDLCPVWLGDMGIGKTWWFTNLLPKELSDLCRITQFTNDKDFKVQLVESAMLVIDEIREKDMNSNEFMKMIMTTPSLSLRPVYTKLPRMRRRIASLCGTGNNHFILRDVAGNRRFVPIWLTGIDRDGFNAINKLDLLAEGYQLYSKGYSTELSGELINIISQISKDFEQKTEADELMLMHYPPCLSTDEDRCLLSVAELCDQLFERTKRRTTFREIANALTRMAYDSKVVGVKTPAGKISKIWKYYCRPTMGNDDDFITLPELPQLTSAATSTSLSVSPQISPIDDNTLAIDEYDTFFD